MVNKSTKSNKILRKEVRLIKQLMPSQREVVSTYSVSAPVQTGAITYLSNAGLDTEKVLLRGIDCRFTSSIGTGDITGCMVRHILFIYDCDVDRTSGSVVEIPVANDILETINTHGITSLQNPVNSRRIQVLYDTTSKLQPNSTFEEIRAKRIFFKKPKEMSAMKDRQRVKRPFVLTYVATASSVPATLSGSIGVQLHTTQLPN